MKRLSLLSVFVLFSTFSNAQDTIVKSSGEIICAKIIELSTTEVKYKKFAFQEGPTYIEDKSTIQSIKYANGSVEKMEPPKVESSIKSDKTLSDYSKGPLNHNDKIERDGKKYWYHGIWMKESEMQTQLLSSNDQQITLLVGKAKTYRKLEWLWYTAIPSVLLGNMFLSNYQDPETSSAVADIPGIVLFFSGTVAISVSSIYFKRWHKAANSEAIKLYNAKY